MHADLSRWTFRPERHYSRVVVQQGRVSLDADANAQASILLHYMRTLAADLIGEFGGPLGNVGFAITPNTVQGKPTLNIGPGHYYVDGLLCEADGTANVDYSQQPAGYGALPDLPDRPYLVVLKVWERFISAVEDPDLREIALGLNGPDTTGRTRVVWQVLATDWPTGSVPVPNVEKGSSFDPTSFYEPNGGTWAQVLQAPDLFGEPTGTLMAQAVAPMASTDACTLSPTSGYRGPENQLYRVEIHRGSPPTGTQTASNGPTFMWSRDNGSVILPITAISDRDLSVTTLGRDPKLSVDVGNYVEIVDDAYASAGQPGPIARQSEPLHLVTAVDPVNLTVTLDKAPNPPVGRDPSLHPYLRRWDQDKVLVTKAGLTIDGEDQAIDVPTTAGTWIDLEDGVQVQFSAGTYRAGDYWLIPARVITGDVDWPRDANDKPIPLPPEGVRYHLAPLAFTDSAGDLIDVRLPFPPGTGVGLVVPEPPEEPRPAAAPEASRSTDQGS